EWAWGFKAKCLSRVYFPKASSPEAFGFLDPACVLWVSYISKTCILRFNSHSVT
ncbi:hypothetical protein BT96DRAFT_845082, partial [Gymnopus androsaceus JB14]